MASTVSLIQMLASGVVTSAGAPVASGQVFFYLPATTTPVSAYADSLAATPIAPPLVLTAGGTGIAYTKVPTRMVVKDASATTTIFDGLVNIERAEQQYIQSASINGGTETTAQAVWDALATSLGGTAGLWKFKAGTGGTERNFTSVINDFGISVKSFGAVGDGNNDDTTPIQNTITFVASIGAGKVTFPAGTYKTTAALTATASVVFEGSGANATIIKNAGAASNTFTLSGNVVFVMRGIAIQTATSSSGAAVSVGSTSLFRMEQCSTTGHATGILNGGDVYVAQSDVAGTTNGLSGQTKLVVVSGTCVGTSGAGVAATGNIKLFGPEVYGGVSGVDMGAAGILKAVGVTTRSGSTLGLKTAATTASILQEACDWGPGYTDGRTGAPVRYTFAADGNFTPLPLQTDTIRADVTAAAVVTINAAAAIGFGRKLSIMLCRATAGAVTWTFNAQYVLQGGAAPAPTNGNMMISVFEYDPISSVYRETSRSASMAI